MVDFHDRDIYDRIKEELETLPDIDVLVNNVGAIMSKRLNYFVKTDADQLDEYFNVNMFSYMKITELILPKMLEKKRGVVISISSQSGVNPTPLLVPYSASELINNLKVKMFSRKTMNSFEFQQKRMLIFLLVVWHLNMHQKELSFKLSFHIMFKQNVLNILIFAILNSP